MSKRHNKQVVDRWNTEVIGQRKLDLIEELLHPDYEHLSHGVTGRDEARKRLAEQYASGKDVPKFTVREAIAEGDYVVHLRTDGVAVYRFESGKIRTDCFYRQADAVESRG